MKALALALLVAQARPVVKGDQAAPDKATAIVWEWKDLDRANGLWMPEQLAVTRAREQRECRNELAAARLNASMPWWLWAGLGAAVGVGATVTYYEAR